MADLVETGVGILTGIVGVATLAVIFSKNSSTSDVVNSAGTAFSSIIKAATSPITGGNSGIGISPSSLSSTTSGSGGLNAASLINSAASALSSGPFGVSSLAAGNTISGNTDASTYAYSLPITFQ